MKLPKRYFRITDTEDFDKEERERLRKLRIAKEIPSNIIIDDEGKMIDIGVDPDEDYDLDPKFMDSGAMEEFDGLEASFYGDGPIDEYGAKQDPFEKDMDDPFGLVEKSRDICMECGDSMQNCSCGNNVEMMLDYAKDDRSHGDEYLAGAALQVSQEIEEGFISKDDFQGVRDRITELRIKFMNDSGENEYQRKLNPIFNIKKGANRIISTPTHLPSSLNPNNMTRRNYNYGPRAERKGEYLAPRHRGERIRNINGQLFQMLPEGGSGQAGNGPFDSKATMRKRASMLREKGYNARVIPMKGNQYGKHALFITKKVRYSNQERMNMMKNKRR